MQRGLEAGLAVGGVAHRPAGQQARGFGDIGLGVAAIHAQRVQLQQLARQVFVEALLAALAGARIRADRLRVVQIQQHRRVQRRGLQQIDEAALRMRADGLVLMRPHQTQHAALGGGHAEMVGPELQPALGHRRLGADDVLPAPLQALLVDLAQRLAGFAAGLVLAVLRTQRGAQHLAGDPHGGRAVGQPLGVKDIGCRPRGRELRQHPGLGIGLQGAQAGLGIAETVGGKGGGMHGGQRAQALGVVMALEPPKPRALTERGNPDLGAGD